MSILNQNASKMNYPHFCTWSIFELGYGWLRMWYEQALAFGDVKTSSAGALGSRFLISSIHFGKSHLEVENHTQMLFFSVFCGILRPFELSCALISPEAIFSAYEPHHCIDWLILHPTSRGFVQILLSDRCAVRKMHSTSVFEILWESFKELLVTSKSSKNAVKIEILENKLIFRSPQSHRNVIFWQTLLCGDAKWSDLSIPHKIISLATGGANIWVLT